MSQVWYYNGRPSDADPACRVQTAAAVVIVVTRQKVVQRSDNFESRGARSRHRGIFLMQLRPGKLWIWGPGAMFEVSRVNSRYLWTLGQCWRGSRSTAVWFRKGCTSAPVQREDHQTPPVEHNKQHQIRQSCRPASIQCVCVCVCESLCFVLFKNIRDVVPRTICFGYKAKESHENKNSRQKHFKAHISFFGGGYGEIQV